ncbi:MAG: hydantoinase/oxoprolinase family protein [Gammaproteobacteria bacterium]|nr:hydantoinase/oxoprolinase family protein [Gammaproteobacteria bacterium]
MRSIDVDVGGTFTDLILNYDGRQVMAKAPTTPHDLSECFMQVVDDAAAQIDADIDELLDDIDVIRYSTTVAMNGLIQRAGPRLGLLMTEGHEDATLIGRGAQWIDGTRIAERRNVAVQNKPVPLIDPDMMLGVHERVDFSGGIVVPLDEDHVREQLRRLVDQGARGIVVSLLWSFKNPAHEVRIKDIIREEYKEHHIGFLPIVLAHQVVGKIGEYERTMTAILDAYLQQSLQTELAATWDRLRKSGYRGAFLLVHNSGGSADLFKTTASRTFNAGPVAGIIGSQYLAAQLGFANVVATDMGGTSFDMGVIVGSSARNYDFRPILDRWMVSLTMVQSLSIGAGGGSIASVNRRLGNRLEVGPRSAGSFPGPVCYDLGGNEPTVTDADLVLGYLAPDAYYGGRMQLDKRKSEEAIQRYIADPLGVTVPQAALLIREIIDDNMASAIRREIHMRGHDPEEFVLFSFGGAGPTHVSGYLEDLALGVIFNQAPVFCAFGQSLMDLVHVHERTNRMVFMKPVTEQFSTDYEHFNNTVAALVAAARKDLIGEGFDADAATYKLELDLLYGGQVHEKRVQSPLRAVHSEADMKTIYDAFEKEFAESFSPLVVNKPGGVLLQNFVVRAVLKTEKLELPTCDPAAPGARAVPIAEREICWNSDAGYAPTPVYALDALAPGHKLDGPAVIQAPYTTVVVKPGHVFAVERHGLGIIGTADNVGALLETQGREG